MFSIFAARMFEQRVLNAYVCLVGGKNSKGFTIGECSALLWARLLEKVPNPLI